MRQNTHSQTCKINLFEFKREAGANVSNKNARRRRPP